MFLSLLSRCLWTHAQANLSSINGGYVDESGTPLINGGGTQFLAAHDGIYGPGGADLMLDNDGVVVVYRTLLVKSPLVWT